MCVWGNVSGMRIMVSINTMGTLEYDKICSSKLNNNTIPT